MRQIEWTESLAGCKRRNCYSSLSLFSLNLWENVFKDKDFFFLKVYEFINGDRKLPGKIACCPVLGVVGIRQNSSPGGLKSIRFFDTRVVIFVCPKFRCICWRVSLNIFMGYSKIPESLANIYWFYFLPNFSWISNLPP